MDQAARKPVALLADPVAMWQIRASSVAIWVLCTWLAMGFLLPNTLVEHVSFRGAMDWLFDQFSPALCQLCISASVIAILAAYWLQVRKEVWASLLCITLLAYGAALLVLPITLSYTGLYLNCCAIIAFSIASGLLAALLVPGCRLLEIISILGTCEAIYTILAFIHQPHAFVSHHVPRAVGSAGTPLGIYCTLLVCIAIQLPRLLTAARAGARLFWLLSLLVCIAALFLSLSRAGLLAVTFLPIVLVRCGVQKRTMIALTAVALALVLAAVGMRGHFSASPAVADLAYRCMLWQHGWRIFCSHPLFGVGISHFIMYAPSSLGGKHILLGFSTPDNEALQLLCELGVLGGAVYGLVALSMYKILGRKRDILSLMLGGAMLLIFVASQFDAPFGRVDKPTDTFLISALLGCTMRSVRTSIPST